jgi:hypothetical protein
MTRFLKTDKGLINVDQIAEIEVIARPILREGVFDLRPREARAVLKEGGPPRALVANVDEIELALLPVVAAHPGYTHLLYFPAEKDGDPPLIERAPIVAWRISGNTVIPVTPEDDDGVAHPNCIGIGILQPDGRVAIPGEPLALDEDAWLRSMARRVESYRRHKIRVAE